MRILVALVFSAACFAQTGAVNIVGGTVDLSSAVHTLPAKKGTFSAIPATCTQGELYFATDATAGSNLYLCTSTNTWTQVKGSSGGTVTNVTIQGTAADISATGGCAITTTGTCTLDLISTAVTPASYGDGTHVGQFNVDAKGRITAASSVTITGAAPTGSAGGDLSGTYPNPTVTNLSNVSNASLGTMAIAAAAVTNVKLANASITVGGATCTLGSSCTPASTAVVWGFGTSFDGGGSAIASGKTVYSTYVHGACTINAWNITVDTGTITIDIWKIATGTAIPTVANTITASAVPAISTGTAVHSTTLTSWTTSVAQNDILGFNVKAVSGATVASLDVQCTQN